MKEYRRYAAIALVGILGLAVIFYMTAQGPETPRGSGGKGRFRSAEGPVPVLTAPTRIADVPVYFEGVGTTKALNTVTVRAQVDGKLISINFKEGQDVKRGDVLAQIDPATYQAQYDQAVAKKAQDEAQLANARLDLERYTRLAEAGTRQQADTQRAVVAQFEALVKSDQAAIDNAKAILSYTKITAPIDGRTGIRLVDEGNIVRASDATGLVTITQIRPITALFSLPQQQLGQINKAFAQRALTVEAMGADNRTVIDRGVLQVIDNQVDQTTGTVRLKAEFPNADLQLWPGQFVNIRLLIDTLQQVAVVPTAAVQRGPNGTFVYVAKPDGTAAVQPVTVAQQDEAQAVIAKGLTPSDAVITTGFARLSDGAQITVSPGDTVAPPPVAGDRPRGGRRGKTGQASEPQAKQQGQRSEAGGARASP
jgi:membrane fusion protein, multidrug efflux system